MRAVILVDASMAARERMMISRLEVGLADEGVRIVHALPERALRWHQGGVFSQMVTYKDEGLPLSLAWRTQRLLASLDELAGPADRPADIIHVFGENCWPLAVALASQTGAALALEVWSAGLVRAAVRMRIGPDDSPATCLAPDAAIERLLREENSASVVRLAPWGVHTPATAHELLPDGRAWSVLVIGSGREPQTMLAAIEGVAAAAAGMPDLMIFADADAVMRANLWPTIKRLGLVDRFTMIPDVEARRDPALRCDVLVCPEARGEHRTLVLDAMATGMLVIAAADPNVSWLIDGRTARIVDKKAADRWQSAVSWALENRGAARELAESARAFVKENCRASSQVSAVMDVYEWLTAGETIPFNPS